MLASMAIISLKISRAAPEGNEGIRKIKAGEGEEGKGEGRGEEGREWLGRSYRQREGSSLRESKLRERTYINTYIIIYTVQQLHLMTN